MHHLQDIALYFGHIITIEKVGFPFKASAAVGFKLRIAKFGAKRSYGAKIDR